MPTEQLDDNYPGERTTTETSRLHAQHDLVVDALGGLLHCAIDKSQPNLRVLDIGTADGWWLHSIRRELAQPETAKLVGTDIAPYPDAVEEVVIHDFRQEFPESWLGSFDVVQLRAVMASAGDAAVDVVRRAILLLKSGGSIQLVDSAMPSGELLSTDKASIQFFKRVGNMLDKQGMIPDRGAQVKDILAEAGADTLTDQDSKPGMVRLGKGSALEQTSWNWIRNMTSVVGNGLVKLRLTEEADFHQLQLAVFDEVERQGVEFQWYATWATKR